MKIPSIVRIAQNQRFNITPRYYDPVKEEIEQRTMAIKKELQQEGILSNEPDGTSDVSLGYHSTLRGSFRSKSSEKSTSLFEKSGLLRLLIFLILLGGLGGYLYLGNEVVYYMLYAAVGAGMWIILNRAKEKTKK